MGRWGWRLFEADQDLDISCELPRTLGIETDWEHTMSQTVHQTDMLAPTEMREFYKTAEYAQELENEIVPYVRQKLDTNDLGHAIFAASVARESEPTERADGKYRTIIVGALMMRVGARIKPEQLQHLRDLVPQIHCNDRFTLPLFDEGFRGPGRVQFLAALDHYQAGVPRSFQEPSCFHCGQIKSDIGHALRMCGRCKRVWYCDRDCQSAHWKHHKHSCVPLSAVSVLMSRCCLHYGDDVKTGPLRLLELDSVI